RLVVDGVRGRARDHAVARRRDRPSRRRRPRWLSCSLTGSAGVDTLIAGLVGWLRRRLVVRENDLRGPSMRLTAPALIAAAALPLAALAAPQVAASSASAAPRTTADSKASCDPFTSPHYAHKVPSPKDVLGFQIGEQEVRVRQSNHYLREVDA